MPVQFARAQAEVPAAQAPAATVITSIQQYWDLTPEEKTQPHTFQVECDVTYFDPIWKILFVQDAGGHGAYVPYAGNAYAFKAGERILTTGVLLPPSADFSFEHATITPLGPARLSAQSTVGKITESRRLINTFVSAEGFVDRCRRVDATHLQLVLSIEGESVVAWVLVDPQERTPDLADTNVRVEGVYNPKLGPDAKLSSLELMIPTLAHLTVVNRLGDDPRFKLAVVPIEALPRLPADRLVRIVGQVKAQEPGRFVRIRDDSGQVDLMTGQTRPCSINETLEAVGYPSINGTVWRLESGLFRASSASSTTVTMPSQNETLRLAAQVLELPADEAKRGYAVWLTGVVTWSNPNSPFFFIQDSSGGVCIMRGNSTSAVRSPGRNMEVRGVTTSGPFAPVVVASRFDKISELVLPQAKQISLEHALTGAEEANWVEMRGYLRQVSHEENWNQLELVTSAGDFTAVLPADEDVSALVGAVIRLHGVCTASTNAQHKLTGIKLWVPAASFVQVEEPAPKDPFDVPARSLASLGQFGTVQSFNRRLRVSGVVLHHSPGHQIRIEDGGENLLVFSRDKTPLQPGDRIEVAGFLGRQGGRVTLREASYRKIGTDRQPAPAPFVPLASPAPDQDGRLVSIAGTLLESSTAGDQLRLTLQTDQSIFEAILDQGETGRALPTLPDGSQLSLTGLYEVKLDEYGHPAAFQLRLRVPGDISVLQRPSWFTRGRVLAFSGALAVAILLFMAWVAALRRQVREQTGQIREQMQRESRLEAELQRAGKLESLGLLAGGIAHDFNNLLTVVMGNLSLARFDTRMEPGTASSLRDAEKAAVRARDLTQQLLTFAKGGAPIRAAVSLPDVVREVAEFALRGSKVRCQFHIVGDLWPANVDKGQIGQVVQNIAINAMQAMPDGGVIDLSLHNEMVGAELSQVLAPGRYVQLVFTDHGTGIRPEDLQRIFDPYFTTKKHGSGLGLATVHSIVKKHLGHISAESTPGTGTTFRIWLPAAEEAPEAEKAAETTVPVALAASQSRILIMDDEESIRKLGCAILRRFGYDASAVSDGNEAVREYSAARQTARPYAAVILDLTVPGGMGGLQTLEQLLKLDAGVKAIVSSGYSNDQVLSTYQAHGFRGMVSKPYEVADLALALERVLKGERA